MLRAASFALAMFAAAVAHAGPTLITSEPDGKTVLHVQDDEIYVSDANKVILRIDGEGILKNAADPALLVVDDDDVRPTAAGLKLATFDGEDIRHGDRGKVVINYHHPDICPNSASNRILRVDGPELTKQQLVAVLYVLKPELFKLTDAEAKEQKDERAKNAAEQDALDHADQVEGKWEMLNANGPVAKLGKGKIAFDKKRSDVYPVNLDFTPGGGPAWMGIANYSDANSDKIFWSAFGTAKQIGLCVYEINGADLKGTWYPWYADGDAKNLGTEVLKGGATFGGEYKIVSAKAPTTGAEYAGTVSIKPLEIVGAGDAEKPYSVIWTLGTTKVYGVGIKTGDKLYVASGAGPDVNIGKFKIDNGCFAGDFFKLGSMEMGALTAMKDN